jgi:hypothetical protein
MARLHASGSNFRIELDDGGAVCRVWSRPEESSEEGARAAQHMDATLRALLASGKATRLLFDISEAPPVVGPVTEQALGSLFAAWEKAGCPVAVLGREHATMKLQFRRMLSTHAKSRGAFFEDRPSAEAWLAACSPA